MKRLLAALAAALAPGPASACTWCVASAFGDRTFNWAYLGLIVAPFLVAAAVASVLVHHFVGFRELGRRLASTVRNGSRFRERSRPAAPPPGVTPPADVG